jgi:hypothetical protein
MIITRRTLIGLIAAPAIIRVIDLMPIKALAEEPLNWDFGSDTFTVEAWVRLNGWSHLAVDRVDGKLNFYRDGARVSYDDKLFSPLGEVAVNRGSSDHMFSVPNGDFLSDLRVTRGVARYTGGVTTIGSTEGDWDE